MKNINFSTLLLFTLFISQNSFAQRKKLSFTAASLSQPISFYHPHIDVTDAYISKPPAFQLNAILQGPVYKSRLQWVTSISYMHVTAKHNSEVNQLFYAQFPKEKILYEHLTNLIGTKLGFEGNWNLQKRKAISCGMGASLYFPFVSKRRKVNDQPWKERQAYGGSSFYKGVLYGFYLKPTFAFTFRDKPSSFRFLIFLEGNLLWRNDTEIEPPFLMAGGGIGFSYSLN